MPLDPAEGPMLRFAARPPLPVLRSNVDLARDFLDLEFEMESGRPLPVLTRFEGPVGLQVEGQMPAFALAETEALLLRLRGAGLVIGWDHPPSLARQITLSFQSEATLQALEPQAACFVLPDVLSLSEAQSQPRRDWTALRERQTATIFLNRDAAPQEIRDCLHEELAQALGPVNDLYRLPDSVFNDDNFHALLTGFDLLMLQLHNAPELASGMSRAEVAARLPALLARLNPGGEAIPAAQPPGPTPRAWNADITQALLPGSGRLAAADRALALARSAGWHDNRLAFALYLRGRLLAAKAPGPARAAFEEAAAIYQTLPDGGIHLAHALLQLAALDLAAGERAAAPGRIHAARPRAETAQNAALLAALGLIEAEILAASGAPDQARALRLDTLPAARYGIGSSAKIRARAAEIAAIARLAPAG